MEVESELESKSQVLYKLNFSKKIKYWIQMGNFFHKNYVPITVLCVVTGLFPIQSSHNLFGAESQRSRPSNDSYM